MLEGLPSAIFGFLNDMRDSPVARVLLYRLGSVICATPAQAVREVVPAGRAVRIPGAAGPVAGLVNIRGRLLTVVDGRRVLGAPVAAGAPASVVVLSRGERAAGLAVDEILDLADLPGDAPDGPPAPGGVPPGLVKAVHRYAGRLVVVLDTEALLAPLLG